MTCLDNINRDSKERAVEDLVQDMNDRMRAQVGSQGPETKMLNLASLFCVCL